MISIFPIPLDKLTVTGVCDSSEESRKDFNFDMVVLALFKSTMGGRGELSALRLNGLKLTKKPRGDMAFANGIPGRNNSKIMANVIRMITRLR
jgi:hypothetical protein